MKKKILLATTLTAAALALTACGGSQPAKDQTAAPAPAETIIAETTKTTDSIIGRWKGVKMVVTDGTDTVETDATTESWYTFDEDGTVSALDNGTALTGTWKSASPDSYIVTIDSKDIAFTLEDNTLYFQFESPVTKGTFTKFVFEKE